MKRCTIILLSLAALMLSAESLLEVRAPAPADVTADLSALSGATVAAGPAGDALRVIVTGDGATSVPLFRVAGDALARDPQAPMTLLGSARLEAVELDGQAYLELLVEDGEGGAYFSRALDQALTAAGQERTMRTPFFFKHGEAPAAVLIGIRVEGTGTILVDQIALSRQEAGGATNLFWFGLALSLATGLWGALTGILASRGKGRGLVLGLGLVLLMLGVIGLVTGIVLLTRATGLGGYGLTLGSGICTLLLAVLLPVVRRRYRAIETARMAAADRAEGL